MFCAILVDKREVISGLLKIKMTDVKMCRRYFTFAPNMDIIPKYSLLVPGIV